MAENFHDNEDRCRFELVAGSLKSCSIRGIGNLLRG